MYSPLSSLIIPMRRERLISFYLAKDVWFLCVVFATDMRVFTDSKTGERTVFGKLDGPVAQRLKLRLFRQGRDVWNTGVLPQIDEATAREVQLLTDAVSPPLLLDPEIKVQAVSPTRPEPVQSISDVLHERRKLEEPHSAAEKIKPGVDEPVVDVDD
jgi:hypothetical protein